MTTLLNIYQKSPVYVLLISSKVCECMLLLKENRFIINLLKGMSIVGRPKNK